MRRKLVVHSSSEVKKAGGLASYVRKNGLDKTFTDKISGAVKLTSKELKEAIKTGK